MREVRFVFRWKFKKGKPAKKVRKTDGGKKREGKNNADSKISGVFVIMQKQDCAQDKNGSSISLKAFNYSGKINGEVL